MADKKAPGALLTAKDFLNNAKWVNFAESTFDVGDKHKTGILPFIHYENLPKKFEKAFNPDPNLVAKARKAIYAYAAEIGLYPSIYITKQEFVENHAAFAERELARVQRGEESILTRSNRASLDLVADPDAETITKEESLAMIRATGIPGSEAVNDALFEQLDKEKTGKISKKVHSEVAFKSWFNLDSSEAQTILETVLKK